MLVFCKKLQQELEGLSEAPFPGPLGERIKNEISAKAWNMWLEQQKMLINESRISLTDASSRKQLKEAMKSFLFEDIDVKPASFIPTNNSSNKS